MKILHTSDWHLGQRFHHLTRHEEHSEFLQYLVAYIATNRIDILIIAGDIFDNANPSREAEKLYFNFLKDMVNLGFCKTIIIGGNHDSASHLNAPKVLLEALDIHIYGELAEDLKDCIIDCSIPSQKLHIACIPFLKDSDIRKESTEDSSHEIDKKIRAGITNIYHKVSQLMPSDSVNIATGHLFALGSSLGDSERSIHVGNLGAISQEDIKQTFDYIALGHLHKTQSIDAKGFIHYCGSPIALSFSEAKQIKEFSVIHIKDSVLELERLEIPKFRELFQIKGKLDQVIQQIEELSTRTFAKTIWIEVKLSQNQISKESYDQLFELCEEKGFELVKVLLDRQVDLIDSQKLFQKDISELSPKDIFDQKLDLYDGENNKDALRGCFDYLLNRYHEGQNS
ncbi:exonuclease SbcCD subunit D C-terminal domain-containing protein [bacterium]|nr:exonuclease SbcCD subunit D C-terminal domain-containing protein [bacterium]